MFLLWTVIIAKSAISNRWIDNAIAKKEQNIATLEDKLATRPALVEGYRKFYASIWTSRDVSRRVLSLCRQRMAFIHDASVASPIAGLEINQRDQLALESGDIQHFGEAEQAALEVVELIPFNHHAVSDQQVKELERHFGAAGCVTLLTAIAFFDVMSRLKLVWEIPAVSSEMIP